MERTFAKYAARTGDNVYAATKAGYVQPGTMGAIQAHKPAVQAEIARQQLEILWGEGLPLAVSTHLALLRNESTPAGARVQAAKLMYDLTINKRDGAGSDKAPHEMTPEELAKAIADAKLRAAALEHVKADRANPIIEGEAIEKPRADLFG